MVGLGFPDTNGLRLGCRGEPVEDITDGHLWDREAVSTSISTFHYRIGRFFPTGICIAIGCIIIMRDAGIIRTFTTIRQ